MPRRALPVVLVALLGVAVASQEGGATQVGKAAAGVKLQRVGTFDTPLYVTAPPGDRTRLFVVEQEGRIRVVRNGEKLGRPFLDIRDRVSAGGERGLLSMAFAPDYAQSKRFYVYFTGNDGDIRIQQYRRSDGNANVARKRSKRDVVRIEHSENSNHNGGHIDFGPDGMLYASTGDGGGAGDPFRAGQSLRTLLGKVIRIDPRAGGGYRTPGDNPFVNRSGARGAIWAYGLRNPFRFSFDRKTGDLTIGDVGQSAFEEIDFVEGRGRGANYGWSVFEANARYRPGSAPGHVRPKLALSHDNGYCAVIGGYVVRDPKLDALRGRYIYGDNCKDTIYRVRLSASGARNHSATRLRVSSLSSFGEDARGRVYATSLGGAVYRLVPQG